jgi:hypothetical protein
MDAGYEPARVHQLARRTLEAIDDLARLASTDPAAAEALRTARLARSNLEAHWLPALCEIERSDALVRWSSSRLGVFGYRSLVTLGAALPDHLRPGAPALAATAPSTLLGEVEWLERTASSDAAASAPSPAELAALGRRVAFWVRRDDTFADQLIDRSVSNTMIARLLGEADFPSSFASAVVRRMAAPNGPDSGVDRDRYAASMSAALASLADDPTACLDLLLDRPTAYALASWVAIDTVSLADVVVSGLHDAVAADPTRLGDGYEVLQFLTRAANGPLDAGMSAGMSLGVAASLAGYIDTLAPAIRQEGPTPVVIRAVDPPLELGTYDDLVDLVGSLLRVPAAEAALGTVLGAYTFETLERVGGDAARRPEVTYVANVADLVGDASRTEQAELVMAAAVQEARRRQFGGLIGFAVSTTLLASGAGSIARSLAAQAVKMATDWTATVEPDRLTDSHIAAHTYDLITVAAVAALVSDPSARQRAGLGRVNPAHWSELARRIEQIDRHTDPHERMSAVGALDHWIETSVPALAAHLVAIRSLPGMHELTEGRNAVATD